MLRPGRNGIGDRGAPDVLVQHTGAIDRERALAGDADVQGSGVRPVRADRWGGRSVARRPGWQHVDRTGGVFLLEGHNVSAFERRIGAEIGANEGM